MKSIHTYRFRAAFLCLILATGAYAHPGPPGHYHPDEVDEFDQVAVTIPAADNAKDFNLGGILILTGIGACLGFALFQKQGGIWKDVTAHH